MGGRVKERGRGWHGGRKDFLCQCSSGECVTHAQ